MRTRYVYSRKGKEILVEEYKPGPLIMPDIKPYKSMIDGTEITSRSRHREHLREHNCIEVGNDSSLSRPPQPLTSPPGLKEKIIRAVEIEEAKLRR